MSSIESLLQIGSNLLQVENFVQTQNLLSIQGLTINIYWYFSQIAVFGAVILQNATILYV